jgi:hypothetical protein
MDRNRYPRAVIHCLTLFTLALTLTSVATAEWKEKVLYSFQGGTDGATPAGGVVFDNQGNLYGATQQGGGSNCSPMAACGTIYQLAPPAKQGDPWTETVLHVFQGKQYKDGEFPSGGVIADALGNIYGTTAYGGTGDCVLLGIKGGCGTAFELSPPQTKGGKWTYTILYSFPTAKQGYVPWGDLVFDGAGNLYGATYFGGNKGTTCDKFYGGQCGTVFALSPPTTKGGRWTEKVLHSFAGGTDGANPNGGLVLDTKGAIYGTTAWGGSTGCQGPGCGTAFELTPIKASGTWKEKMLHVFTDGDDGAGPNGGLVFDSKGALYGTAGGGGGSSSQGVAFRLARVRRGGPWTETILHAFSGFGDAPCCPVAGLVFDSSGNIYGASLSGTYFRGTVFRLEPPMTGTRQWRFGLLYTLKGVPNSAYPEASLIFDKVGTLYSTTQGGGTGQCQGGCGTVFALLP